MCIHAAVNKCCDLLLNSNAASVSSFIGVPESTIFSALMAIFSAQKQGFFLRSYKSLQCSHLSCNFLAAHGKLRFPIYLSGSVSNAKFNLAINHPLAIHSPTTHQPRGS